MTRKESREQAFAIVFESSFHNEGLDYILENAADGRDLILNDGDFAKELARETLDNRDEIDGIIASCSTHWKPGRMARTLQFCELPFAKCIISAKKCPQAFP